MSLAWPDFAAALGLVLVIEGILPFLSPSAIRRAAERFATLDDRTLRVAGATSMIAGALIVSLARG